MPARQVGLGTRKRQRQHAARVRRRSRRRVRTVLDQARLAVRVPAVPTEYPQCQRSTRSANGVPTVPTEYPQ
jgi:hypothetical protein